MSVASVRTSGRRDSFPVLPKAAGNKREPGSFAETGRFEILVQELFQLVVHAMSVIALQRQRFAVRDLPVLMDRMETLPERAGGPGALS